MQILVPMWDTPDLYADNPHLRGHEITMEKMFLTLNNYHEATFLVLLPLFRIHTMLVKISILACAVI